jgi:hypothetical protein
MNQFADFENRNWKLETGNWKLENRNSKIEDRPMTRSTDHPMSRWASDPMLQSKLETGNSKIANHKSQITNDPMTRFFSLKLTACKVKCRLALRIEVWGGTGSDVDRTARSSLVTHHLSLHLRGGL